MRQPSDLRKKMQQNEIRDVNVQSSNHLNLLMMYLVDLVLSLENLRLLNEKLHGSESFCLSPSLR